MAEKLASIDGHKVCFELAEPTSALARSMKIKCLCSVPNIVTHYPNRRDASFMISWPNAIYRDIQEIARLNDGKGSTKTKLKPRRRCDFISLGNGPITVGTEF